MKTFRLAALVGAALVSSLALTACGSDDNSSTASSSASDTASASASTAADCFTGTLNAEGSSAQKNAIEEAIASYGTACSGAQVQSG